MVDVVKIGEWKSITHELRHGKEQQNVNAHIRMALLCLLVFCSSFFVEGYF